MAKIAILGFGTVGSGVYEVLCRNAAGVSRRAGEPVEVKYILDPKDFSGPLNISRRSSLVLPVKNGKISMVS